MNVLAKRFICSFFLGHKAGKRLQIARNGRRKQQCSKCKSWTRGPRTWRLPHAAPRRLMAASGRNRPQSLGSYRRLRGRSVHQLAPAILVDIISPHGRLDPLPCLARSPSLTPFTWLKRAIAARTCAASSIASLRC
jgi:hypothetical protein